MSVLVTKKYDFEGFVALLHIISSPFGIEVISSSNSKSITSKIRNGILPLCITSLLIISYMSAYKLEDDTRARKLLIIFKGCQAVGTILTILYNYRNGSNFRETINKLRAMDEILISLQEPLNYKSLSIILFAMYIFILFFSSLEFALVLFDTLDRPTWFILSRLFFECYQVMFGLLFTIYFNFFCIIFIIGFVKIKNILNAIRDNAIEKRSQSPIKLLLAASRMYEDIFYGVESFNRMVSVPLLTMVVTNTFDSLVIITIIYNGEQNKMDYLHLGAIGMFYVMVILSAVAVTQLSEQLCDILGECNICYTDIEMSLAKNTFLLQLCHQKINFSICKMIPLTMDALVNIFTFGTTIVIFLFQLANTW